MLSRLRLPTLRSPGQGLPLTLMKWLWNMSVSMLLLSSLRREERTLARLAADLDEMAMEYERVHAAALITE